MKKELFHDKKTYNFFFYIILKRFNKISEKITKKKIEKF